MWVCCRRGAVHAAGARGDLHGRHGVVGHAVMSRQRSAGQLLLAFPLHTTGSSSPQTTKKSWKNVSWRSLFPHVTRFALVSCMCARVCVCVFSPQLVIISVDLALDFNCPPPKFTFTVLQSVHKPPLFISNETKWWRSASSYGLDCVPGRHRMDPERGAFHLFKCCDNEAHPNPFFCPLKSICSEQV